MNNKRRLVSPLDDKRDGHYNVPDNENCEIGRGVISLMAGKFQSANPTFIGHFQIADK